MRILIRSWHGYGTVLLDDDVRPLDFFVMMSSLAAVTEAWDKRITPPKQLYGPLRGIQKP